MRAARRRTGVTHYVPSLFVVGDVSYWLQLAASLLPGGP
jgi:hypothetical protein